MHFWRQGVNLTSFLTQLYGVFLDDAGAENLDPLCSSGLADEWLDDERPSGKESRDEIVGLSAAHGSRQSSDRRIEEDSQIVFVATQVDRYLHPVVTSELVHVGVEDEVVSLLGIYVPAPFGIDP